MMKPLLPGIWQWAWFSDEKQIHFNGLLLTIGEHKILIDPPPMTVEDKMQCRRGEPVDYILVTNRDHARESGTLKQEFDCKLFVPEADAGEMDVSADKTYKDGELLPGGIWAIHLQDQKSPGESALFVQQGKGIMIVGDALIGREPGTVTMLPSEKYADSMKAKVALQRLTKYNFDTLLVGDGTNIMTGAKPLVEEHLRI